MLNNIIIKIIILFYCTLVHASSSLNNYNDTNFDKVSEAIISIAYLMGSVDIPLNEISFSFNEEIENKKFALKKYVKLLQKDKLLFIKNNEDNFLLTLNNLSRDIKKITENKMVIKKYAPYVIRILNKCFDKNWEDLIVYMNSNPQIISFTENFLKIIDTRQWEYPEVLKIKVHLLEYYMYAIRDHNKALILMQSINDQSDNLEPTLKALFISNKANLISTHFASNKQRMEEVITQLEHSYNVFISNNMLDEALRLLSCWAQVNIIKGNIEQALELLRKGEDLIESTDKLRYKAIYYYVSAWCYTECGEYEKCIYYADKAINCLKISPITPLLMFSYNLKADALFNLEKFEEAFYVALFSLNLAKDFDVGRFADWKGEALIQISKCKFHLNDLAQSEEYLKDADEEYQRFFSSSEKHIDQAAIYTLKGKILIKKKKLVEGLKEFFKSLTVYNKILQNKSDFEEVEILYELIFDTYLSLNLKKEAIKYYHLHEKCFGIRHPRTIKIKEKVLSVV